MLSNWYGLLFAFCFLVFDCFYFQKYLHNLSQCARSFGVLLEFSDLDLSVIQEAISTGAEYAALYQYLAHAIAYTCEMMDDRQREWLGFDRWYGEMMEYAVFGSVEDPIIIDD